MTWYYHSKLYFKFFIDIFYNFTFIKLIEIKLLNHKDNIIYNIYHAELLIYFKTIFLYDYSIHRRYSLSKDYIFIWNYNVNEDFNSVLLI